MSREPILTWFYSLVVVRHQGRFLALREATHEQGWYLPAGRCEPGERLGEAARRECLEETGVPVELDGVLAIQHGLNRWGARLRVIFSGHPSGNATPKSKPDEHSLEARWVTTEELAKLPLRHPEVLQWFRHVEQGGTIHPLGVLTDEPLAALASPPGPLSGKRRGGGEGPQTSRSSLCLPLSACRRGGRGVRLAPPTVAGARPSKHPWATVPP